MSNYPCTRVVYIFQLYAFCIFPMHAIFHNYTNILHITTEMMLAEKDV